MGQYKVRVVEGPSGQRYRGMVLGNRPLAYYRLGELSGAVASDTANGHNGAYSGNYTLGQVGRVYGDKSIRWNADVTNPGRMNATIPVLGGECALETWIQPGSMLLDSVPIGVNQGVNEFHIRLSYDALNKNYRVYGRTSNATGFSDLLGDKRILAGRWAHIIWVRVIGGRLLYINGILSGWDSDDTWVNPTQNLQLADGYVGLQDEAIVWNRRVSAREAMDRYRQGPLSPGGGVAELEKAEVDNIGWVLNGSGSMSFGLPTREAKGVWAELVKREIQVWWNDQMLWQGIPFSKRIFHHSTNINCIGLWAYFNYRYVHRTLRYDSNLPQQIATDLVRYAQTEWVNAGLNIEAAELVDTGARVKRVYHGYDHGQISHLINNFTDDINGFDYDIRVLGDGRREFTTYYPRKGLYKPDKVLEWGRNISEFEISEYGDRMANWVTYTGEGEAEAKVEASYLDAAARDEYVLMQHTLAQSNVSQIATLLGKAQVQVEARNQPIQVTSLEVRNEPTELVQGIEVGDWVPVRIDHGAAQVEEVQRIVHINLKPATDRMRVHFNKVALDENE